MGTEVANPPEFTRLGRTSVPRNIPPRQKLQSPQGICIQLSHMLYQGRFNVDGGGGEEFLLSGLFIPTKGVIRDLTVLPSVPISLMK